MKRTIIYIFAAFILASCADKVEPQYGAGQIAVELVSELPVKSAVELTPEEAALYRISVLDADGAPAVYESPEAKKGQSIPTVYYKDFETVTVDLMQMYQVTAESCTIEESESGNGCARFFGNSGLFELNASNIYQKARIICSQTNAMVTVVFDPSVKNRFTDLKVTLNSGQRTLVISESADEVKTYFTPGQLSYTVSGIYAETSYNVNIPSASALELDAKANIRILVRLDLTHGQASMPSLSVTEEYADEVDEDCQIDPYM